MPPNVLCLTRLVSPFSNPNFESETHLRPKSRALFLSLSNKSQSDFEARPLVHSQSEVESTTKVSSTVSLSLYLSQPSLNPYQSDSEIHLSGFIAEIQRFRLVSNICTIVY
ncbi:unnamed protein product [Camellia sinensis]